jgi:exodeoxyribonuclease V
MDLTPHQHAAVDWLVDHLTRGVPLVALRGLAGTGKTTLIPHLRDALHARGMTTAVGAPTHRAAVMLRQKGIEDAATVHALALIPSFSPDYANAVKWLGGQAIARPSAEDVEHPPVEDVPYLLAEACGGNLADARELKGQRRLFGAQRLLDSVGLRGQDFFREFTSREGDGCLILDEASMVDAALLERCHTAFPRICLVGDPGQLAPIDGASILASVEGFTLEEIHRQAADSPIVQLAYRARSGEAFWRGPVATPCGTIQVVSSVPAAAFLQSPLLVYRNDIRKDCTRRIRAALGYPADTLQVGEPLVCRSTEGQDRELGFYNNSMWRVLAIDPAHPREVTLIQDGEEESIQTVRVHIEEIDGPRKHPKAIWFRFGYAITCHTAQGGEWSTVYIAKPELLWYHARCQREQAAEESSRWNYTAITRAKDRLVVLSEYRFTTPTQEVVMAGPTSAPMLHTDDPLAPTAQSPLPASLPDTLPQDDDVADPVVPAAVLTPAPQALPATVPRLSEDLLPMAQGFCQYLQATLDKWLMEEHSKLLRGANDSLVEMRDFAKGLLHANGDSQAALATVLSHVGQGLMVNPYKATMQAVSPAGYVVTIEVVKRDGGELVSAIEGMQEYLQEMRYTAMPAVAADFD